LRLHLEVLGRRVEAEADVRSFAIVKPDEELGVLLLLEEVEELLKHVVRQFLHVELVQTGGLFHHPGHPYSQL
jgi:hypothetical protein